MNKEKHPFGLEVHLPPHHHYWAYTLKCDISPLAHRMVPPSPPLTALPSSQCKYQQGLERENTDYSAGAHRQAFQ